jgi:hypothetical protein
MTRLVLVGLATDGPSNVAIRPNNERDLRFMLGGGFRERIFISPTATAVDLSFDPWSMPINEVDGQKNYLFSPYYDQNNRRRIQFGNIGGSQDATVDFTYTPYLGKSDLIFAARKHIEVTGQMPYVVRLGGKKAVLEIDGWVFEAKYAGKKYNRLSVTFDENGILISGLEPGYPLTRHASTSPADIKEFIKRDYAAGMSPVVCVQAGSAMVANGTYYLTDGEDGEITEEALTDFLANTTLPIDVTHVVILAELHSGLIESILTYYDEIEAQPRMFFANAPAFTSPASAWIETQLTELPYRHNMLAAFLGNVNVTLEQQTIERFAVEAASIAFVREEGYNLTNIPVNAVSFFPVLNESDLNSVKAAGFIPLMRYIRNDISVYEGTTTGTENSFLYSSKVAEVSAIAKDYCYRFIGTILPDGDRPEIAEALIKRLRGISFLRLGSVGVGVKGDSMFVNIEGILPSEILRISFSIKNR